MLFVLVSTLLILQLGFSRSLLIKVNNPWEGFITSRIDREGIRGRTHGWQAKMANSLLERILAYGMPPAEYHVPKVHVSDRIVKLMKYHGVEGDFTISPGTNKAHFIRNGKRINVALPKEEFERYW
jgi:hypothetical protein